MGEEKFLSALGTPEKFENATVSGHFVVVREENSDWDLLDIFFTSSFSERLSATPKLNAGIFRFRDGSVWAVGL